MKNLRQNHVDGVALLRAIANKDINKEAAVKAFHLFTGYFEHEVYVYAVQHAEKLGFEDHVAFEATQCAFNKVWLYPSFSMKKSKCTDEKSAITIWLMSIVTSQMYQYAKAGVCAQIKEEEDLSIIECSEDFVNHFHAENMSAEQKLDCVLALDKRLSVLDEKHRIIYLTYKAYHTRNKKLPRKVLENLRQRLGLTQATVRVYKREACNKLGDFTIMDS